MVHYYNSGTLKAETGGLSVEANLSNISRVCLKKIHLSPLPPPQKNFQKLNSIEVALWL